MKIKKHFYTWNDVEKMVTNIITQMYNDNFRPEYIVGITRGGLTPAIMMSNRTSIPMKTLDVRLRDTEGLKGLPESNGNMAYDAGFGKKILVVDDINDTGATFNWIKDDWLRLSNNNSMPGVKFAALTENLASDFGEISYYAHEVNKEEDPIWLVYPWE
tara:strand:- start:511 stop:987 length:477 start_codon:yes stop_codon:yes gene_type:complete